MSRRAKGFFFRYYLPISAVGVSVALAIALTRKQMNDPLAVALTGGSIGLVYFVQKQKLEETKLFKELFEEFNRRYDELNGRLFLILRTDSDLTPGDETTLIDYFNLCAEEHLFYQDGYVHEAAWKAWTNGMCAYWRDLRVRKLWEEELRSGSYYGFDPSLLASCRQSAVAQSRSEHRHVAVGEQA